MVFVDFSMAIIMIKLYLCHEKSSKFCYPPNFVNNENFSVLLKYFIDKYIKLEIKLLFF